MLASPVTYRPAVSGDVDALAGIAHAHYGGDLSPWADQVRAALHRGETILVAEAANEAGGAVVAYGKAGQRVPTVADDPAPAGFYLTGLVVSPARRREGHGARLVRLLVAGRAGSRRPVWSFANAQNEPSLSLHRAAGFVEVLRAPLLLGETFTGAEGVLMRIDPPA